MHAVGFIRQRQKVHYVYVLHIRQPFEQTEGRVKGRGKDKGRGVEKTPLLRLSHICMQ